MAYANAIIAYGSLAPSVFCRLFFALRSENNLQREEIRALRMSEFYLEYIRRRARQLSVSCASKSLVYGRHNTA